MPPDPAHVLLNQALDDERLALLVIGNLSVSDEQVGFLAQQAVEKALKAVLSFHQIPYRRTHDLSELLDLLKANQIAFPASLEACIVLTPFAAQMRYDYLPPENQGEAAFDRAMFMQMVRTALEWAGERLSGF